MSDFSTSSSVDEILEYEAVSGFRIWHFLSVVVCIFLFIVMVICCCINFRIPRTKQEIEANYERTRITKKFRKQLDLFPDSEMDQMDLMTAISKVKSDLTLDPEQMIIQEEPFLTEVVSEKTSVTNGQEQVSTILEFQNATPATTSKRNNLTNNFSMFVNALSTFRSKMSQEKKEHVFPTCP